MNSLPSNPALSCSRSSLGAVMLVPIYLPEEL